MAIILGLDPSHGHPRNGMILTDMFASQSVAQQLGEVIVYRSTGPWAKRWIERGHPTKNFHVKGKSSDWGPQAGFIPYDARYSKRPDASGDEAVRTKECAKSVHEGWARAVPLILSRSELEMQLNRREGNEVAIRRQFPAGDDFILFAGPQGSGDEYVFRARRTAGRGEVYQIMVYKNQAALQGVNNFKLADMKAAELMTPLLVMASNEVGADDKAITGDYDLFVVVPTWASYGSRNAALIHRPGVELQGQGQRPSQSFAPGVGMDNVLDPTLHTFGRPGHFGPRTQSATQRFNRAVEATPRSEHADMGNLTPRVLRAINALNGAMGAVGTKNWTRRVHHNAENYRNAMFGAMSMGDMLNTSKGGGGFGDGFPLTAFLPRDPKLAEFGQCCTIETYHDLQHFGRVLNQAGYYVPKNAAWGLQKAYDI
jgi:hypothetical protein